MRPSPWKWHAAIHMRKRGSPQQQNTSNKHNQYNQTNNRNPPISPPAANRVSGSADRLPPPAPTPRPSPPAAFALSSREAAFVPSIRKVGHKAPTRVSLTRDWVGSLTILFFCLRHRARTLCAREKSEPFPRGYSDVHLRFFRALVPSHDV